MSVIPFARPDGGAVFTCSACGYVILAAVSDGVPTCALCRWLDERPQIPKETRDRIRGLNSENGCGNG